VAKVFGKTGEGRLACAGCLVARLPDVVKRATVTNVNLLDVQPETAREQRAVEFSLAEVCDHGSSRDAKRWRRATLATLSYRPAISALRGTRLFKRQTKCARNRNPKTSSTAQVLRRCESSVFWSIWAARYESARQIGALGWTKHGALRTPSGQTAIGEDRLLARISGRRLPSPRLLVHF